MSMSLLATRKVKGQGGAVEGWSNDGGVRSLSGGGSVATSVLSSYIPETNPNFPLLTNVWAQEETKLITLYNNG